MDTDIAQGLGDATSSEGVLRAASALALDYAMSIDDRNVAPDPAALAHLDEFDEPLPESGADELQTLRLLAAVGSPATVATTGRRYFGFVNGATHPVALGSSWLADSWDQNAALPVMSPVAAKLHDVVRGWLVDVLRLPPETGVAFVSGATMANASCLAAARDALAAQLGWDVQADGLFGAPGVRRRRRSTGRSGCGHGPNRHGRSWSGGSTGPTRGPRTAKWLNVTYDCGIAFVRRLADLRRTFAAVAGYLPPGSGFEAMHHTPQSSQRARQVEVWAVLATLGRRGVQDLVSGACDVAQVIAERLDRGGLTVLNDVVLNQVLVRLVDGPTTEALVAAVQSDGRLWCGPTQWGGATAMRISVSSWKTDLDDAAFDADVILDCARRVRGSG